MTTSGYYDQYMYQPLLVFDCDGWPVAVVLLPGRASASQGATSVLLRIFSKIVERLPRHANSRCHAFAATLNTHCE
jgi:hypothetical protein